jgi:hypothetical protein
MSIEEENEVSTGSSFITVDIKTEDQKMYLSLGVRLALLQGVFDVTYRQIYDILEAEYGHQKSWATDEEAAREQAVQADAE